MARKKSAPPSGPNNAYLISFGDTMTALLAFFIVLLSMAEEQTGANLYSGTGSFIAVGDAGGVPGMFKAGKSRNPTQLQHFSPKYIVNENENAEPDSQTIGPDKDGEPQTVKDRDQDNLERFLLEMEHQHKTRQESDIAGEVAFDRMPPLPREDEPFDALMRQQLLRFAPVLRRPGYELEIRVWATTPAPSAWQRAALQATRLHQETVSFLKLPPEDAYKVTATASPWHSSDIKRPAASFLLKRVQ